MTDGSSTYNPATIINANTTTIDGGKITTGSINADRLSANTITAAKIAAGAIELNGTLIGSNTLPAAKGGTGLTSTATLTNSGITMNANGTLSGAGSGQVTAAGISALPSSTTIPTALSQLSGTLAASAGGTGTTSTSTFLNSNVSASSIGLSAVANLSSADQLKAAFTSDTSMSAGQIKVSSSAMVFGDSQSISSNSILIEADSSAGARIIIAD
jgi:hypothetical protein